MKYLLVIVLLAPLFAQAKDGNCEHIAHLAKEIMTNRQMVNDMVATMKVVRRNASGVKAVDEMTIKMVALAYSRPYFNSTTNQVNEAKDFSNRFYAVCLGANK
jgi:hypothetical protein